MTGEAEQIDWSGSLIVLAMLALLTTLGVAAPGLWIAHAAEHAGAFEYRSSLRLLSQLGGLGAGLAACFGAPRWLGALMAAAYAVVMLVALASGQLSAWLALPLAAIYGGLRICVWAVFFERVTTLGGHAASLMLILSGTLQSVVFLFASAGLREFASPTGQRAVFGLALLVALLSGAALTLFGSARPRRQREAGRWQSFVAGAFLVWLALGLCTDVLEASFVRWPALSSSWAMVAVALVVQLMALGLFAWLGATSRETPPLAVAAWLIAAAGTLLAPLTFVAVTMPDTGGQLESLLLGTVGGAGAAATLVVAAVAGLRTPSRFLPLVLACGFMTKEWAARPACAWVREMASQRSGLRLPLMVVATVMVVCFFALRRLSRPA